MTVNDPALVRELARLHDAYEHALGSNDVAALDSYFWNAPQVVRYGVAEELYGADAVRSYRQGPAPTFASRRLTRRVINVFGSSLATVMCEVDVLVDDVRRRLRQSQTWVHLPSVGWRIVSAHVSVPIVTMVPDASWGAYTDRMAQTLDLPLTPEQRAGVAANLERIAAVAASMLALPLDEGCEPAFSFIP